MWLMHSSDLTLTEAWRVLFCCRCRRRRCLCRKQHRWPAALNRYGVAAGRCEHLTLPSSLMGTHCVLTFKFPRYLPSCLSRCFPPPCYLTVRPADLTADLKHRSGTSVLFNDSTPAPPRPPPPPLSVPQSVRPISLCLNTFCLSPPSRFPILLPPISLRPSIVLMRVEEGV